MTLEFTHYGPLLVDRRENEHGQVWHEISDWGCGGQVLVTIHSPLGKEHAEFLLNAMQQEAMRRYKERNTPSPSGDAHEQEGRGR